MRHDRDIRADGWAHALLSRVLFALLVVVAISTTPLVAGEFLAAESWVTDRGKEENRASALSARFASPDSDAPDDDTEGHVADAVFPEDVSGLLPFAHPLPVRELASPMVSPRRTGIARTSASVFGARAPPAA